jgi:hypothetical protein
MPESAEQAREFGDHAAAHWPADTPPAGGRRVRLDPRGGERGAAAGFAAERAAERLAWVTDPAAGEFDYPTVHPSTPPVLLRALTRARPGVAGYDYLPSEL